MQDKVIFLDRDGTINQSNPGLPIYKLELFKLIPGSGEAIRTFNDLGFKVLVATNQGGINHRKRDFSWVLYEEIDQKLHEELAKEAGAKIDRVYVCHHASYEGCKCRKPEVGLFEKAAKDYDFNPAETFMIGDSTVDIIAGKRFGLRTILVKTTWKKTVEKELEEMGLSPDFVTADLLEASQIVKESISEQPSKQKRVSLL